MNTFPYLVLAFFWSKHSLKPTLMRIAIFSLCIILLSSCTPKVYSLKGNYGNGNFEQKTDKNKEQVWSNLVDFFAKNGLAIKIIDKNSGLITSERAPLLWSLEKDNGQLYNTKAWVAVEKTKAGNKDVSTVARIFAEWNVRVKDAPGGGAIVGINLVNAQYLTPAAAMLGQYSYFKPGAIHSTGVFERMIFDTIK